MQTNNISFNGAYSKLARKLKVKKFQPVLTQRLGALPEVVSCRADIIALKQANPKKTHVLADFFAGILNLYCK